MSSAYLEEETGFGSNEISVLEAAIGTGIPEAGSGPKASLDDGPAFGERPLGIAGKEQLDGRRAVVVYPVGGSLSRREGYQGKQQGGCYSESHGVGVESVSKWEGCAWSTGRESPDVLYTAASQAHQKASMFRSYGT